MAAEATITPALARFAAGLRYEDIPAATLERAKDLLLDHLGVALAGSALPWSRSVHALVAAEGGAGQSTLYGGGRAPARAAALANGTAAHANEFDDTHDESLNHPGCVVIPAALAVAEARGMGGRDFLAAMVAGYEVQCRIGAAVGATLVRRGFHPTAACGVFGSAAAAGRLLGLDAAGIESAWGSAASMSSGLMRFADDPAGTMIKRMHGGLPAERGVLAAQLAASGFLGPRGAIDGEHGFAPVLAGAVPMERMLAGLGKGFEIDAVSVKLYPCCKMFHSLVEAIAQCRAQRPFTADEVVAAEALGPAGMLDAHMEYHPASDMSAQYSLPYTTAAAMLLDPTSPGSFGADARANPGLRRLCGMVTASVDPALEAVYPRRFAGGVRIRLADGTELAATVIDSRSSPGRPVGREDVLGKFNVLTHGMAGAGALREAAALVASLERCGDVGELTSLLAKVTPARSSPP